MDQEVQKQPFQQLEGVKKPHKKLTAILLIIGIILGGYLLFAKSFLGLWPFETSDLEVRIKISNYLNCIDFCEESFRQVVALGPEVVPFLIEIVSENLDDNQANNDRDRAIGVLGVIGDQRALDILLEAVRHPYAGTRFSAVAALGGIGGDKAYNAITFAFGDTDSGVREIVAKTLARMSDSKANSVLENAFDVEKEEFVQKAILESINILDPLTIEKVKEHSLPKVLSIAMGDQPTHMFLFARNQIISTLAGSSCGGDKGAKEYRGDYQLVVVSGNKIISSEFVGKDFYFIENRIHDGIQTFIEPTTKERITAVYQYASCNIEKVKLFRIDNEGLIKKLSFVKKSDKTTKVSSSETTGPDGQILIVEGKPTFCEYNNSTGTFFCNQYDYDGKFYFNGRKSWESQKLPESQESITILSDVPSMYSDCSWQELSLENADIDDTALHYDNWQFINRDLNKRINGYAKLGGKAWLCQWRALSADRSNEIRNGFEEYYKNEFSKRGWQFSLKTNNFEFQGAAADGPDGSIWGYLAENNGKIRAVALSWFGGNVGSLDLTVFISDIVSVNTVLP